MDKPVNDSENRSILEPTIYITNHKDDINVNPLSREAKTMFEIISFANEAHKHQVRKNGDGCYLQHPLRVAEILFNHGISNRHIIHAAILHDTIEDTSVTYEQIVKVAGKTVADYVKEVTDDKSLPKIERKKLQIANAPKKSDGAAYIKMADKIANLEDMEHSPPKGWSPLRIDGYREWAFRVVLNLPERVIDGRKGLVEFHELDNMINDHYQLFFRTKEQRDKLLQDYYNCIE